MKITAFKTARFSGILLLLVAVVLLIINPKPKENLPQGFKTPIIAFEFIQSQKEVDHFFKVDNVSSYKSSMLLGNQIDYGFMCLYSFLLFCIALGIKKITNANSMYIAMFFCSMMLLFDALENWHIFQIIQLHPNGNYSQNLDQLTIFTWLKWSSIASTFLLFSPFFFKGKIFHKIIGFCCVLTFGLCIAAFVQHGILNELFSTSVVLVFLLLIIFVFTYKEQEKVI